MVDLSGSKHVLGNTDAGQRISNFFLILDKRHGKTDSTRKAGKMLVLLSAKSLHTKYQVAKRSLIKTRGWWKVA
jgi:hypothetical protein